MDAENYVIQYPLDAVHVDKFADLLGKPKTAVSEMVKANKLPIIELRDPCKPKARAGEKWVFIPEFNRAVREAFYNRPVEQRDAWLLWMGLSALTLLRTVSGLRDGSLRRWLVGQKLFMT